MFAVHETGAPPEPISGLMGATVPKDRTQPQIAASARDIDVATLLRSPMGLRGAVIVREILGPPRGLRAPDLMTVE
jgi:ribosome biogenesis SPOUT family RNA methylase Rps3